MIHHTPPDRYTAEIIKASQNIASTPPLIIGLSAIPRKTHTVNTTDNDVASN
jgi:hypothetical protein